MAEQGITRRKAIGAAAAGATALTSLKAESAKPALLGGSPVRTEPFSSWPLFNSLEEQALLKTLRSGKWNRAAGQSNAQFEDAYKQRLGARHCLAVANGTSALLTSLQAIGVSAGDEVIVPPYTFVATINAVLSFHALPVFVDTDPETFQIDAKKIEAAITDRTSAILPVHLGGSAADLDTILPLAKRRNLPVIEDACQSHLAEWRGRKVGTLAKAGCFSFQASKNLNSGEGGAVVTDDAELAEQMYALHNNGRGRQVTGANFSYGSRGLNLRLTEFQASLLMAQMSRLDDQAKAREKNAQYLTSMLREIPGITPARMYEGCTRNAYHLYMFRYDPARFAGLPRATFLKAIQAEGIPASGGYSPLNKEPFLARTFATRGFQRLFPAAELKRWEERTACPANDRLCSEAVWLTQTMLLGERRDMEQIAEAIRKVQSHAAELARG